MEGAGIPYPTDREATVMKQFTGPATYFFVLPIVADTGMEAEARLAALGLNLADLHKKGARLMLTCGGWENL